MEKAERTEAVPASAVEFATSKYPWFAISVRSNFERIAASNLTAKGYESFLPQYRSMKTWGRRSRVTELPLFKGYFFSRFDPTRILPVLTTPGVVHIVSASGRPLPVPEREIEFVRAVVASPLAAEPWPYLHVGDQVILERGPLAGLEGVLVESKKNCRFVVSVYMLQRAVAVEIDRSWARLLKPRNTPPWAKPACPQAGVAAVCPPDRFRQPRSATQTA